ncbi:MAG: S8 family serine peptidase, partial [Verrucomicrobiae bacterium]|nr:S8 family serine peptidase [Verrucomicrobiae bacterium]
MKASQRRSGRFCGGVLLATLGWLAAAQVAQAGFDFDEKGNPFCTGEALVTFKSGLNPLTVRSVMTRAGVDPSKTYWFDTMSKFLAKRGKVTARQRALADQLARTAWVKFDERGDVLSFCERMKADKANVDDAAPNRIGELAAVPNDFFYGVQWAIRPISKGVNNLNPSARVLNGTVGNFPDAWNIATGAGVRVAILDTGCDLLHGDLVNKIVYSALAPGAANAMPPGADNPPFSADPTKPWDDVGHGTVVAGIIGAQWKNRKGIVGAAPNASLMIIKITSGASINPTQAALAAGINLAVANDADIINMSLHTGTTPNAAVLASILLAQSVGITPVAAVGNYVPSPVGPPTATYPAPTGGPYPIPPGTFLTPTGPVLTEPASYPGVIAVGGHPRESDPIYSWHGRYSYVTPAITVVAPGGIGTTPWHSPDQNTNWAAIFSTWPRYTLPLTPLARPPSGGGIARGRVFRDPADGSNDSYTFMDLTVTTTAVGGGNNANAGGTSLAAAHVSGATALLKEKHPWFWPSQMLARHIRFADRADATAIVDTNVPVSANAPSYPRLNPFDAILFPPTTPSGRSQPGNVQLLINPPFNPYIGYGLLDVLRLL